LRLRGQDRGGEKAKSVKVGWCGVPSEWMERKKRKKMEG